MKTIVVIGSSHSISNTKRVIKELNQYTNFECIDLSEYNLEEYHHSNIYHNTDFIDIINKIIYYDNIVLATPIYWYTMSAKMKIFIDRYADLLTKEKNILHQLKLKKLYVVSCGDTVATKDFYIPFILFAKYLGIKYEKNLSVSMKKADNYVLRESMINRIKNSQSI